nr:hypothetical protein [Tanacetum cinerariifolium]
MEVDIDEEENELELIFSYVEADPLNPPPLAFDLEFEDDGDSLFPSLIRRDINSLFGQTASLTRRVCGRETAHALVEKKGKAKDKYYGNVEERVECKKLKKELEDTRGVMFKQGPNEAIDVLVKDEESLSSEPRGSPCVDSKNLLDRVSSSKLRIFYHRCIRITMLASSPEHLKADNTVRVNQIVTIFLIESSIHLLDQYRYPVNKSSIHIESQVTYQELVCCWLKKDFHLHYEYISITQMFWENLKDNA